MNDVKLYSCYSLPLRKYLYDNGVEYELAALNPNSKSLFWIYIKTEKLYKQLIDKYFYVETMWR